MTQDCKSSRAALRAFSAGRRLGGRIRHGWTRVPRGLRRSAALFASAAAVGVLLGGGAERAMAPSADAQAIVSTGGSLVATEVVTGLRGPDGSRDAGLVLTVAPGWKTYWRVPGEAGVPPRIDWSRSENVAEIAIDWPMPTDFISFGLRTLGYEGRVVLPMTIRPIDPAEPVKVALDVSLGVCDDICVLEQAEVDETIMPDDAPTGAGAIASARARVPGDGAALGLTAASCSLTGAGTERAFHAELTFAEPLASPYIVLEGPEEGWFHGKAVKTEGGAIDITAQLSLVDPSVWVERSDLRITVLTKEGGAADIRGCKAPAG